MSLKRGGTPAAGELISPAPLLSGRKTAGERKTCAACGAEFEPRNGKGRPRRYCYECAPPGDAATINRTWRRMNPEYVEAYNERRRKPPFPEWVYRQGWANL